MSSLATVHAMAVQSSSWYVRNPLGVCVRTPPNQRTVSIQKIGAPRTTNKINCTIVKYAAEKARRNPTAVHCRGKSPIIILTSSLATVHAMAVQSSSWYIRNHPGVCLQTALNA